MLSVQPIMESVSISHCGVFKDSSNPSLFYSVNNEEGERKGHSRYLHNFSENLS